MSYRKRVGMRSREEGQRAILPANGLSTADIIQVIKKDYNLLNFSCFFFHSSYFCNTFENEF